MLRSHRYIFPDYDSNKDQIERLLREHCNLSLSEGIHSYEYDHVTLYGIPAPCEVIIVPVRYQGEQGYAVYLRDLREARLMQAETKRREIAEEESRAKTHFLARMSHEIRTPMNVVLGVTETQLQREDHPPETEEAFTHIFNSSRLLLTIINDILDLSKVEAGKMEVAPTNYDTAGMISDTIQLNLLNFGGKDIDFCLKVDEHLPSCLVGDELRIKQILNNIISNAFKYTAEGTVELSFAAEREPMAAAGEVTLVICVSDTGKGMAAGQAESLFSHESAQFDLKDGHMDKGGGLGLTIAHSLVRLMRGEIRVESTLGEGSIFTVRLPQISCDDSPLGSEVAASLQDLETSLHSFKK
ncbi:MAG: ATP-binding protein, partial [Defluviitaleaceae bacterium]|nr:ATP-binding protein [Defluviitaleaceae bacterium]